MTDARDAEEEEIDWSVIARSNYASTLLSSPDWFHAADELWRSAELIAPQVDKWWAYNRSLGTVKTIRMFQPGCQPAFMMMCGFAVENYCKGKLVESISWDDANNIRATGVFPASLRHHRVGELLAKVAFPMKEFDEGLSKRLERAVVWHGRYPVAISVEKSLDYVRLTDGKRYSLMLLSGNDVETRFDLLDRLREHVGAVRYRG